MTSACWGRGRPRGRGWCSTGPGKGSGGATGARVLITELELERNPTHTEEVIFVTRNSNHILSYLMTLEVGPHCCQGLALAVFSARVEEEACVAWKVRRLPEIEGWLKYQQEVEMAGEVLRLEAAAECSSWAGTRSSAAGGGRGRREAEAGDPTSRRRWSPRAR